MSVATPVNTLSRIVPWATLILVVIVAVVGGVIAILDPATLPFDKYLHDVAVGGGLLALGRGIDANSRV